MKGIAELSPITGLVEKFKERKNPFHWEHGKDCMNPRLAKPTNQLRTTNPLGILHNFPGRTKWIKSAGLSVRVNKSEKTVTGGMKQKKWLRVNISHPLLQPED